MENIRCLIVDIPQVILADIVTRVLEDSNDIEVVGRIDSTNNLLEIIREKAVDVLIVGIEADRSAKAYFNMLDTLPGLIIVGITEDGRQVMLLSNDVSPRELTDMISFSRKLRHKSVE